MNTTDSDVRIDAVRFGSDELAEELTVLLGQLSASAQRLSGEDLRRIVGAPGTTLFIAYASTGRAIGMLTLLLFRIPSGLRALIEDVVVDVSARRKGLGQLLMNAAIAKALAQGARTIDLTSRPSRDAANRLYQRSGFERRDTNVYRLTIRR